MWTFFGPAGPALGVLGRLPVGVLGLALAETEPGELDETLDGRALGFGCIDPRTTLPEDPQEVARLVGEIAERLSPPSVWLGPGGPLDLLPFAAASKKLETLPRAAQRLAGAGGSP